MPNLIFYITESILLDGAGETTGNDIPRGSINVDASGHFSFNIKVYNPSSQFSFFIPEGQNYRSYGGIFNPIQPNLYDTAIHHFNIIVVPTGETDLHVNDSDLNKFDSIQIHNPYYSKNIIRWPKTKQPDPYITPNFLFTNPFYIYVIPDSYNRIIWTYFKNGKGMQGKEIDYTQANFGVASNITMPF